MTDSLRTSLVDKLIKLEQYLNEMKNEKPRPIMNIYQTGLPGMDKKGYYNLS